MGTKSLLIIIGSLLALFAFRVPSSHSAAVVQSDTIKYDSLELKKHSIYICEGHFFEWCKDSSVCPHCGEKLVVFNLWEYYKKLECEDCKKYFEENYRSFSKVSDSQ